MQFREQVCVSETKLLSKTWSRQFVLQARLLSNVVADLTDSVAAKLHICNLLATLKLQNLQFRFSEKFWSAEKNKTSHKLQNQEPQQNVQTTNR